MIELTHQHAKGRRTHRYKTMRGAKRKIVAIAGNWPRLDPDGYLIATNGDCLFISGAEWQDFGTVASSPTRPAEGRLIIR
jgi:hypothetical protein